MKRTLIYAVGACIGIVAVILFAGRGTSGSSPVFQGGLPVRVVHIGGRDVWVTVADTPSAREKGLGGRAGLAPDEGMLFIFPSDGEYGFWMKDMQFPIDMLWLSSRGEVVGMQENVAPATYPAVFASKTLARFILELPAGFSEAYTVKVGDEVKM